MSSDFYAQQVMQRCDILAEYSEEPGRLTRRFATPALRQASETVARWMQMAGMNVSWDQIGNLRARYEADQPVARTLLLGSHLDSVRDAGKYDGPLGVLVALACVQRLADQRRRLPFAIEILAFADEEGVRYQTAYLGSTVVAGTFDPASLQRIDADGITMAEAIRLAGGDPDHLADAQRRSDDLLGYCEVHIEQGPVLEAANLPVGVVTAIQGQSRFMVRFIGEAGHAGTVPMAMRHDSLCAAAEFILAVETTAHQQEGLVATVGMIDARPGAQNVIPGITTISLDVRHQNDTVRVATCTALRGLAKQIAARRTLRYEWQPVQEHDAVPCSAELSDVLERAIESGGGTGLRLPSGAGHDAAILAAITPVTMLFVRCKGGISHNPAESVTIKDVAVAINVIGRFVDILGTL